ncbi:MAG: Npun_F5749 family FMN-dependent PPOX-type flavoprotein [Nodosilinea sp.]
MSDSVSSGSNPVPLAPWREPLSRALHRNRSRPYSRYFQLATVTPQGHPANRTVVFRGFLPDRNELIMVTDRRSQKMVDFTNCPWAEICWYFTQTREQFRLAGSLVWVGPDAADSSMPQARRQTWDALSAASRQSFYWPHPGQTRSSDEAAFETAAIATASPDPAPNFCLVLLTPTTVDHLELRGEPQNRTRYEQTAEGPWRVTAVNP